MSYGLVALPEALQAFEPAVRKAARYYACFTNMAAEDLAQEARLALWLAREKLEACEDEAHRKRFAALRIRGAIVDALRRDSWCGRRDEDHYMAAMEELPEVADDDDASSEVERRELLRTVERRLTDADRALIAKIFDGRPFRQIADEEAVTLARVSQRFTSLCDRVKSFVRVACN
jgi:RNA polymerase sigma factor (sigma-70 family)